jgi:hypothetical protein
MLLGMGPVPVFGVSHFELSSFVTRLCIKVYNFISTCVCVCIYIYTRGNVFNLIFVNIILSVTTNLFILVSEKA